MDERRKINEVKTRRDSRDAHDDDNGSQHSHGRHHKNGRGAIFMSENSICWDDQLELESSDGANEPNRSDHN